MTIEKAKILDDILTRFKGNVRVKWSDLQNELGNTREYYVTENNIKYLLGEGLLKENEFDKDLALTDKGFAVYTDLTTLGYVKKAKDESRDKKIKYTGFGIVILTFLILIFNTIRTFDRQPSHTEPITRDSISDQILTKDVEMDTAGYQSPSDTAATQTK